MLPKNRELLFPKRQYAEKDCAKTLPMCEVATRSCFGKESAVKTHIPFFSVFVALAPCFPVEPSGEFVELHSCDLYTGGCTASSESTLLGRQLFRVWSINQATWDNQDLTALKIALLDVVA